jgi:hypothetical protein
MRLSIATLILAITLPGLAQASGSKTTCKARTSSMYKFCKLNARTKQAKAACKADYKHAKGQCK